MTRLIFKIHSEKRGKDIEVYAEVEGKSVYKGNKPVLCSCTGNTEATATEMIYENGAVICPNCGRKSIWAKTDAQLKAEREAERLANLHLDYFGKDYITGHNLFKLSAQIDHADWKKVSHLFMNLTPDDVDMAFFEVKFVGWVTTQPDEVEKILNIPEERTVEFRKNEAEKARETERKAKEEVQEIKKLFQDAEIPKGKFELNGETIDNPYNEKNIYGGGEWFVIADKYIWYVQNNGFDGADWGMNNVKTGGAGAIGRRLNYSEELAERIRSLQKN